MQNFLISLCAFVMAVSLLTLVHELGHFWCARKLGVKVNRFSIGLGKVLYSWYDKYGTEYVISAWPFGGYVSMLDESFQPISDTEKSMSFTGKSVWARMAIVCAGPVFSFLFAIAAYWLVFLLGISALIPVLGVVPKGSVADLAGLRQGQEIISIDGHVTKTWKDVLVALMAHLGEKGSVDFTVKDLATSNQSQHVADLSFWSINIKEANILQTLGIKPLSFKTGAYPSHLIRIEKFGIFTALQKAVYQTKADIVLTWELLAKMLAGKVSMQYMAGPFSIAKYAGQSLQSSGQDFLSFLALISISVGVLNLLPLPPLLDGGKLLFLLLESIRGRPLTTTIQKLFNRAGGVILATLVILALYNDYVRLAG